MREITYWQAINEALDEEMARDESVFIIGEGVQAGTLMTTSGLVQKYGPERVMDSPLSEMAIAGAAVGAAMAGYRPVADLMFGDFIYCCADEVLLKAAKWRFIHGGKVDLPLVFMGTIGGYRRLGAEHSQCPEAIILHNPGLKLAIPASPYDAKGLMKSAIRDNNPVVFFFHKGLLGDKSHVPEEEYLIPFGEADIKRTGNAVTVIATGLMVKLALQVAEELENRVDVEVIDPRTLEPFDLETVLKSVDKTGRVIIVDEDTERCGVGAEIAMQIMEAAFDSLDAPIKRVCAANYPIAGGYLEDLILPHPEQIKRAVMSLVG